MRPDGRCPRPYHGQPFAVILPQNRGWFQPERRENAPSWGMNWSRLTGSAGRDMEFRDAAGQRKAPLGSTQKLAHYKHDLLSGAAGLGRLWRPSSLRLSGHRDSADLGMAPMGASSRTKHRIATPAGSPKKQNFPPGGTWNPSSAGGRATAACPKSVSAVCGSPAYHVLLSVRLSAARWKYDRSKIQKSVQLEEK